MWFEISSNSYWNPSKSQISCFFIDFEQNFTIFISKIEIIATMFCKFFLNIFLKSIQYKLRKKNYFIFFECVVMKIFIVEVSLFGLKFHQILVEINQNPKFFVFSLILSRISAFSFQKSKSLQLCVVNFFQIYFWKVYPIIYQRKIIWYYLDA